MTQDQLEHLSKDAAHNVHAWLTEPKYAEYKVELEELIVAEQWKQLEDAFFKVIEFGTGGRRGTTGIGSNRINRVTIGESTQALCEYALLADPRAAEKGIVIACDTRLSSPELSRYAAQVAAANGFKTYLFESFRSTPELSFAVRELGTAVGIVISASHNPPADNGFKGYWSDGGQLVAPHDRGVLAAAAKIEVINVTDYDQAVNDAKIIIVGKELDDAYIAAALAEAEGEARDLKVVYSPLHGAGQTNTLPLLRAAGFAGVSVVEAQMTPDGNFPTVENNKANPEERAANDRAVAQLIAENADIAITNDPDADRIGVIVREPNDKPFYLTGNMTAVLAADYVLQKKQARGELTPKHYVAKTIVTTDMLTVLADHYGVKTYTNMLIGFKYIGRLLRDKEGTDEQFVIGCEESYGLLKGTYARDKDGAIGALPVAEYAAELKLEGKTLVDRLFELYGQYGLYMEQLHNIVSPGADGFTRMQQVMAGLREHPPALVSDQHVTHIIDYKTLIRRSLADSGEESVDCDAGDVVVLEFGDPRRRITVRPSGTEPKLKFYIQWYVEPSSDVRSQYHELSRYLEGLARELEGLILGE